MPRNVQDIQQAIESGNGVATAAQRSTVSKWGVVLPTQTRSQRTAEAVNLLERRSSFAVELQARGGGWVRLAKKLALEVLSLIELYQEWFVDYEPTPSATDSSGAVVGIPFGDWADLATRIDLQAIETIASQELS